MITIIIPRKKESLHSTPVHPSSSPEIAFECRPTHPLTAITDRLNISSNSHSASLQALVAAGGNSLASMLGTAASAAQQQSQHQQQQQPPQPQQSHLGQQQQSQSPSGVVGGGFVNKSPTPGEIGPKDSKKVEIPELIVGAILGK